MTTFVLLHGAWHGGWCWSRVSSVLRAAGHTVFSPTFSGVSDRAHLLSPAVGLATHIEDVTRLIDAEGLADVVLVAHSYAGMVASGVAEQRPAALRARVHLDAFVPSDGEAAIDLLPETVAHHYHESVAGPGFGWLIPPRSLEVLGVTEQADLDWLSPRLTPQPWATYADTVHLTGAADAVPATFIECTEWMRVFSSQAERARGRGWASLEIATGHEAMVTAPAELAALLQQI
ncbi:MAG: alpha/beta hydrolase [Microbacteriaceae bacterium]|nr:alpha/beta hydrolase [Microbacteriaceae bacterium]